jgi:hypothetical protein
MHQVEITQEQLSAAWRRARIAAVVIFVGFFTLFVAFAPDAPKVDAAPAMAAAVTP